jgi:hypothetical protein
MEVEHIFLFEKGTCFSDESADALPKGVIKAFDMACQSGLLAHLTMGALWQTLISPSKIAETPAFQIFVRQFALQTLARSHRR